MSNNTESSGQKIHGVGIVADTKTVVKRDIPRLCGHCGRSFRPKFSYQAIREGNHTRYYCSQTCADPSLRGGEVQCCVCSHLFIPTLALHMIAEGGSQYYVCSPSCRVQRLPYIAEKVVEAPARVIAVLNQKGGTGKTTSAVSIAAGLAQRGERTLLIDFDPQGNVGFSLDLKGPRTIYHLLQHNSPVKACAIRARKNLDVITADEGLAAAEIELARANGEDRTHRLKHRLDKLTGYDYVILDCAPALSVLNHNALVYAGEVLIPVSCDYLALVGVKQVLKTLRRVGEQTGVSVQITGVLPTFFHKQHRSCREVLGFLEKSFGARMLPPIRVNTRLAEAPSHKKTIFEHQPDSNGARDYMQVVDTIRKGRQASVAHAA